MNHKIKYIENKDKDAFFNILKELEACTIQMDSIRYSNGVYSCYALVCY